MEQIFQAEFDDSKIFESLDKIEQGVLDIGDAAKKTDAELEKAFDGGVVDGVIEGIKDAQREYAKLTDAAKTLRGALRTATNPDAIKLYERALRDTEKGMKQLEQTAKQAGVNLKEVNREGGLGKQVFNEFFGQFTKVFLIAEAIRKVIDFTKYAVDLAAQTKLATLQFTAFLGSAEKAGDAVGRLQAFAGKKFLNTQDVLQAGKSLLAFGENVENLETVLSEIADISAATGKNFNELVTIFGKARAAGILYAEDINQLVDAGIPIIQEFAKQMGVSADQVKKLASEGKISFEELELAFFNLTTAGGKFADQAEQNAETVGGAWRGLLAELEPIIAKVGGFFEDVATKSLNAVSQFVKDVKTFGGAAFFGATTATDEVGAFFDVPVKASEDALKRQNELEEAAAKRRAELARKTTKDLAKEAEKRRKDRLAEFDRLLEDVDRQADALDIDTTFNPIERVEKQYAAALEAATKLQNDLIKVADTPKQKEAIKASMERLFKEIVAAYDEELSKAEIELEKLKGGKIREALNPLPPLTTLRRDVTDIFRELQLAIAVFEIDNRKKTLGELLGLSDDQVDGLKEATKQVLDSISQIADARVQAAEEVTRQRQKDLQEAQDFLIRQQELAAEGLANDTDLAKQEVERQRELRDAALKEEAKARRAQILLDSVSQISSLITASANIFKSLSVIPFAGIPLAIATIATMFGAFAKAKSDALKSAAVPKFRKGTKLEGRSHEAGGLAISDEHGNIVGEAEGDEWLIGTRPSREHDRFLERLNKGEFAGVNLDALFRTGASNPITEAAPRIERIEREFREIRETQHTAALAQAYYSAAADIVRAIEEKEVVTPLTNYRVMKKRGRNTYTKIVREEK